MLSGAGAQYIRFQNGRVLRVEDDWVTETVTVSLDKLISDDLETFLDRLSEKVTGQDCLSDIAYSAVGVDTDGDIRIEVTGRIDELLENGELRPATDDEIRQERKTSQSG